MNVTFRMAERVIRMARGGGFEEVLATFLGKADYLVTHDRHLKSLGGEARECRG